MSGSGILWAGGEDVSFVSAGGFSVSTSTALFRSTFARCGMSCSSSSVTFPPATALVTPGLGALTTFWIHGQFSNGGWTGNSNPNGIWFSVEDSAGITRLAAQGTGVTGQFKLVTVNSAGTVTTLVTSASGAMPGTNPTVAIDVFVNYAAAGQFTVYINGIKAADTGPGVDITTNSVTALATVLFGSLSGGGTANAWSECVVSTTSTVGMVVQTIPPVASGATQSWTGTVSDINEVTNSTSTFINTTAGNALSEWTVSTALPAGNWTIAAVAQAASVSVGTTGPQHFAWDVHTSAGASFQSGTIAATTAFGNFQNVWLQNPSTSAPWQPGQLLDSGLESLA